MSSYQTQSIPIDGMHCDACVRRVTHALGSIPGVRVHGVEVGKAEVMAEPASSERIREAIEKAGFTVHATNGS